MNFKRIGRILVCLLLVCALVINISPIKARATGLEGLVIAGASTVSVPLTVALGAAAVFLGIMSYEASHHTAFDDMVARAGAYLSQAGTYVKNGCVEMVRVVTETGESMYYVAADFLNAVQAWAFESGTLSIAESYVFPGFDSPAIMDAYAEAMAYPFHCVAYNLTNRSWYFIGSDGYIDITDDGSGGYWIGCATDMCYTFKLTATSFMRDYISKGSKSGSFANITAEGLTSDVICTDGLTLGAVLTMPIDGTSARTWSDTVAANGLYIASGGNQGDPDDGAEGNNNWKFMLPLALIAGADLYAMTQAEQWIGRTPQEFDDYTTEEELTVTPAPEFDGYPAIEVAPAPSTNPDPGTGTDSDVGGDSAESTWWQRLYQWLLDIRTSINELPNRFDEHFENVNSNIQEVPSKFESWIQNVQTSVDSVAESILGTADEINAAISNLPNAFLSHVQNILSAIAAVPQAIVTGIKNALIELFVPDTDYLPNKIQALVQEFGYLEPIISLGDTFKAYFTGVNPTPPVIWIDLGASAWYPMGGRVKFIDLTWYAQYKPTVDGIIGAFLWLWFLWRLLQAAPGIIQGSSGFFGNPDPHPDSSFNAPNWPSGQRLLQSGSFYHSRGSGDKHKFNE